MGFFDWLLFFSKVKHINYILKDLTELNTGLIDGNDNINS